MDLIPDWKLVLEKAWSVRLLILAGVLSAAEVILPFFSDVIPRGLFAAVTFPVVGGALIARVLAQKEFS